MSVSDELAVLNELAVLVKEQYMPALCMVYCWVKPIREQYYFQTL